MIDKTSVLMLPSSNPKFSITSPFKFLESKSVILTKTLSPVFAFKVKFLSMKFAIKSSLFMPNFVASDISFLSISEIPEIREIC